jgi:hypothetical protein
LKSRVWLCTLARAALAVGSVKTRRPWLFLHISINGSNGFQSCIDIVLMVFAKKKGRRISSERCHQKLNLLGKKKRLQWLIQSEPIPHV